MWPTLKRYWHDARLALHIAILLAPFALAAWVFHAAVSNKLGVALGVFGAAAVLLFFGKMARMWGYWRILLPELWRMVTPIAGDLARLVRRSLGAASFRVRTDWRDLRRWARR